MRNMMKIGTAAVALLLSFMVWALGGNFTATWLQNKGDDIRNAGREMISAEDKLAVYRRMIANDEPLKEKSRSIVQLRHDLREENLVLRSLEEREASLLEMIGIIRDDLVKHPNRTSFTYRLSSGATPQTFERAFVERDLLGKTRDLTAVRGRKDALRQKIALMDQRHAKLCRDMEDFERLREEARKEIESAEFLRVVIGDIKEQEALLSAGTESPAADTVRQGLQDARELNRKLQQRIDEGKLYIETKNVLPGLDPRPASPEVDAIGAADAVLGLRPVRTEAAPVVSIDPK